MFNNFRSWITLWSESTTREVYFWGASRKKTNRASASESESKLVKYVVCFFGPPFTFLPPRLTRVRLHTVVEDTLSFSFSSSSSPPHLSPFFPCRPPNPELPLRMCSSLRSSPRQQYRFWKLCQQNTLLTHFKKTASARAVTRPLARQQRGQRRCQKSKVERGLYCLLTLSN